jgi:hypothetical protein
METYDYYLKALNRYNKSKEIWSRYSVGVKDSKESLYSVIIAENLTRMSHSILDKLENNEEFCGSCMFVSLDSLRKAIHRYLIIETELTEEQIIEMSTFIEDINELCMPLNKWYNAKVETCVLIENEDLGKIKAYLLINNPYDEDNEDDDE